jgi:hypothetical protein
MVRRGGRPQARFKGDPRRADSLKMRVAALALPAALVVSACGGAPRRAPALAPSAATATAPAAATVVEAPPPPPPPAPIDEAARAESEQRHAAALALYEQAATSSKDEAVGAAARLGAARQRLSADPAIRDLRKAQTLLEEAALSPSFARASLPMSDVLLLLRDLGELRTQLRTIRADVKALETEIAKKDEALRRVTSAVVGGRTP